MQNPKIIIFNKKTEIIILKINCLGYPFNP